MRAKIVWFSGSKKVSAIVRTMGKEFVGVAKCSPEDTFDLKEGVDWAEKRAKAKARRYEYRELTNLAEEAREFADRCETQAHKSWYEYSRLVADLQNKKTPR